MHFTAPATTITLDGALDDWACAPIKAQTPFLPYNDKTTETKADAHCCGGRYTIYDDRNGASGTTWDSLDHSTAVSFAWDAQNFYIGVKVIDDQQQNGAAGTTNGGWNGWSLFLVSINPPPPQCREQNL